MTANFHGILPPPHDPHRTPYTSCIWICLNATVPHEGERGRAQPSHSARGNWGPPRLNWVPTFFLPDSQGGCIPHKFILYFRQEHRETLILWFRFVSHESCVNIFTIQQFMEEEKSVLMYLLHDVRNITDESEKTNIERKINKEGKESFHKTVW